MADGAKADDGKSSSSKVTPTRNKDLASKFAHRVYLGLPLKPNLEDKSAKPTATVAGFQEMLSWKAARFSTHFNYPAAHSFVLGYTQLVQNDHNEGDIRLINEPKRLMGLV